MKATPPAALNATRRGRTTTRCVVRLVIKMESNEQGAEEEQRRRAIIVEAFAEAFVAALERRSSEEAQAA